METSAIAIFIEAGVILFGGGVGWGTLRTKTNEIKQLRENQKSFALVTDVERIEDTQVEIFRIIEERRVEVDKTINSLQKTISDHLDDLGKTIGTLSNNVSGLTERVETLPSVAEKLGQLGIQVGRIEGFLNQERKRG